MEMTSKIEVAAKMPMDSSANFDSLGISKMTKKTVKPGKKSKLQSGITKTVVRRKRAQLSYAVHIFKVLRQIHPDCGISRRAMNIMNSFMNDIFDRIATESTRLLRTTNRRTLTNREVETAIRLLLPGELAMHAVSEGTKSVAKYTQNAA
mmetsp:Transcript_118909/g.336344  ORF Transcript_118909/g.336344 Transcript_118909/m.336344 type:complete len:150 (+) Transcript_118909:106-555(+)